MGNRIVQSADLIVIIGSRLDSHHLGKEFNKKAVKIYIDIDKNELNKKYPIKFHKKLNKIPDFNFEDLDIGGLDNEFIETFKKKSYITFS
jgi:hypothetical protein